MKSEEWLKIPGFDGYYASSLGRIKSERRKQPRILSGKASSSGYVRVFILHNSGKRLVRSVHSLVALTFFGKRPEGMEVCHNDGNPSNNRIENLRYDSRSGNIADVIFHNGHMPGSSFSEQDVIDIRNACADGISDKALAEKYDVSLGTIRSLRVGRTFSYVGGPITKKAPKISKQDASAIRQAHVSGRRMTDLAEEYSVSLSTINLIIDNLRHIDDDYVPQKRSGRGFNITVERMENGHVSMTEFTKNFARILQEREKAVVCLHGEPVFIASRIE